MKFIEDSIVINASVERVWTILTRLEDYPDWNPFIRRAQGKIAEGERLRLLLKIPDGLPMRIRPVLLKVIPGEEIRWRGSLGVQGLFDGEHRFLLDPEVPDITRFTQKEAFRGVLVPLVGGMVAGGARRGFRAMNRALKIRAETSMRLEVSRSL